MPRLHSVSHAVAALAVLACPIEATVRAQDVRPQASESEVAAGKHAFDAN